MKKRILLTAIGVLLVAIAMRAGVEAQTGAAATDGAKFSAAGALQRPTD